MFAGRPDLLHLINSRHRTEHFDDYNHRRPMATINSKDRKTPLAGRVAGQNANSQATFPSPSERHPPWVNGDNSSTLRHNRQRDAEQLYSIPHHPILSILLLDGHNAAQHALNPLPR